MSTVVDSPIPFTTDPATLVKMSVPSGVLLDKEDYLPHDEEGHLVFRLIQRGAKRYGTLSQREDYGDVDENGNIVAYYLNIPGKGEQRIPAEKCKLLPKARGIEIVGRKKRRPVYHHVDGTGKIIPCYNRHQHLTKLWPNPNWREKAKRGGASPKFRKPMLFRGAHAEEAISLKKGGFHLDRERGRIVCPVCGTEQGRINAVCVKEDCPTIFWTEHLSSPLEKQMPNLRPGLDVEEV